MMMAKQSGSLNKQHKWTFATLAMCLLIVLGSILIERAQQRRENVHTNEVTQSEPAKESKSPEQPPMISLVSVKLPALPPPLKLQTKSATLVQQTAPDAHTPSLAACKEPGKAANVPMDMPRQQMLTNQLSSAQMRIDFPVQEREKRRIFDFLYQCVGIGLGAIQRQASEYTLMPLINFPDEPSKLLRRISGQMSQNEITLQQVYARNNELVRVYPAKLDFHLVQHLSEHLHSQSLQTFTGEYRLEQNRLLLSNIYINERFVPQTWMLFDGVEQRCRL